MKYAFWVLVWFLFLPGLAMSQSNRMVKGKILNSLSKSPIADCSVFISNSSIGAVSNSKGEFELVNIPEGKYELVVSSIGYDTYVMDFASSQLPITLEISLKPKPTELAAITVEPAVKNGWSKWGKTFFENFIGATPNSKNCSIKNNRVLHFWYSKKKNRLTVHATEPLIIQNKALGYIIRFQLEDFYYDFNSRVSLFTGYPFFQEMPASEKKRKHWIEERRKVYFGSIVHFMQCLYSNRLNEEGFQVIRASRVYNQEKQRVQELYKKIAPTADTFRMQNNVMVNINQKSNFPTDSINYYNAVLSRPDSYDKYIVLSAEKLVTLEEAGAKSIFFKDTLHVIYRSARQDQVEQSEINLITPSPIQIEKTGFFYPPQEVLVNGYWARFVKIANFLPLDYRLQDD